MEKYHRPLPIPAPKLLSARPPLPPSVRKVIQNEPRSRGNRPGGSVRWEECDEENKKEDWVNPRLVAQTLNLRNEQLLYMSSSIYSLNDGMVPPVIVGVRKHQQATVTATYVATRCASPAAGSRLGSPHRRRQRAEDGFAQALARHPPPLPPPLIRRLGSKELSGLGKVKVMLKVCESREEDSPLAVDPRRRQVTLTDPAATSPATPEDRRLGIAAPKMFAFDAIFTDQEPRGEVCATALSDVIHAVLNGTDGCLFTFGHSRLGKTATMIGSPEGPSTFGVVPSAISWLYKCITEQKQRTGARFSVRVSAVEVAASSLGQVNDLLAHQASAESDQSPSIYLCEGALQSYCELRAPSPEKAGFYLDTALGGRSEQSHLFYTLHVYQYSVAGKGGVAGGRSRLHLVDLGGCDRSKGSGGLPLSAIGNVLLAIFNGQKHLPHREHKLSQQLKECMGSLTCHAAMIAHVSPLAANYSETLTTIQLASRIHRMRRKRFKFLGAGAGPSGEDVKVGSSDVDPSSSEQSADTVIYVGPSEETDGEHPPVYIPSLNSGDNRCAMNKALRGSLAEQKLKIASKSVPASPQRSIPEDKGSLRKIPKPVSTRSSPARKAPEEQWVDGPRILKSRVNEGRSIHRGREKRETWVDGPKGYGFMDAHKKNMIRKWVENQSALTARHSYDRGRPSGEDRPTPSPAFPVTKVVPLEKLQCTGVETEYEDEEEMEVEIIEIEEPAEPVPMQDCCLQVTEEDIALCMGGIENPLPEVDQDEHPLRILSQENLTVVSTFADSMSVANGLENMLPRNGTFYREMSEWQHVLDNPADIITKKLNQYEQLSTFQDLYKMKKAEVKPVSRCQSLMFSEFITGPPSDVDVNSIASEPAYLPGDDRKYCDNCKVNLEQNDDSRLLWRKQEQAQYHSYRNFSSISSLRHPDGASNPNLRELCREPGNGAEAINGRKDDEEEIAVPPPLQGSMYTLNREGYENVKSIARDIKDLKNGQVHDPGGKGQYCRNDVERLDKSWDETLKSARLRELKREHKFVKAELTSARQRLFSPFSLEEQSSKFSGIDRVVIFITNVSLVMLPASSGSKQRPQTSLVLDPEEAGSMTSETLVMNLTTRSIPENMDDCSPEELCNNRDCGNLKEYFLNL